MSKQIFGREPATIIAAIQAVLALALSFGWLAPLGLRGQDDLAVLVGVLSAVGGVYLAFGVRSTLLAAVLELFKALTAFGAIYSLALTTEQTGYAVLVINTVFALLLRDRTTPQRNLAVDGVPLLSGAARG